MGDIFRGYSGSYEWGSGGITGWDEYLPKQEVRDVKAVGARKEPEGGDMADKIALFKDDNGFLSNFYPCTVTLDGMEYPSVEHAFQAAKTTDLALRQKIREATTPGKAKRMGSKLKLSMSVPAWDTVKVAIMYDLVKQKFSKEPLRTKLLDTGDAELIEGNWWGDTFWGVCMGKGENRLGVVLMLVRDELREGGKE